MVPVRNIVLLSFSALAGTYPHPQPTVQPPKNQPPHPFSHPNLPKLLKKAPLPSAAQPTPAAPRTTTTGIRDPHGDGAPCLTGKKETMANASTPGGQIPPADPYCTPKNLHGRGHALR
ncbi:MAG: hypothetical protein Q9204_004938 [Flavoplaca sp. TL-2023a]